jgi:hypothetical protein
VFHRHHILFNVPAFPVGDHRSRMVILDPRASASVGDHWAHLVAGLSPSPVRAARDLTSYVALDQAEVALNKLW